MSKVMMVIGMCALSLCLTGCKKDETATKADEAKAKVGAVADAANKAIDKVADAAKAATKK